MTATDRPPRVPRPAVPSLLLLHFVLGWAQRAPALGAGGDDAVYLLLGRSLLGLEYQKIWAAGGGAASQYPPVYPALLAIAGATGQGGYWIGVILNLLLSTAALGVLTALVWRWSPIAAVAGLAIAAVNPGLLGQASIVSSEPAFSLFLALTLWCVVARPSWRWQPAIFAVLAAFTRSIGVAVLAGLILYWVVDRQWRPAAGLALASAVALGAWFVRVSHDPEQFAGQSYLADARIGLVEPESGPDPTPVAAPDSSPSASDGMPAVPAADSVEPAPAASDTTAAVPPPRPNPAVFLAGRVAGNLKEYLSRDIPTALAVPTMPGTSVDNVAWVAVLLIFGAVGALALVRWHRLAPLVMMSYIAILAVWPYVLVRFIVPVTPIIAMVLAEGAWRLFRRDRGRGGEVAVATLTVMLAASALSKDVATIRRLGRCDRANPYRSAACFPEVELGFLQTVVDAGRLLPADAALLTPKAPPVYYLIGRKTLNARVAQELAPEQFDAYLAQHQVRHLLVSAVLNGQAAVAAQAANGCEGWGILASHDSGRSILLARQAPDSGTNACQALRQTDFSRP